MKTKSLPLDVLIPVPKSLDLRVVVDLRDALLFTLSFVCGARAKEALNMTRKDVTVLEGGTAVLLAIRPKKYSTYESSTHSCQFGNKIPRLFHL